MVVHSVLCSSGRRHGPAGRQRPHRPQPDGQLGEARGRVRRLRPAAIGRGRRPPGRALRAGGAPQRAPGGPDLGAVVPGEGDHAQRWRSVAGGHGGGADP